MLYHKNSCVEYYIISKQSAFHRQSLLLIDWYSVTEPNSRIVYIHIIDIRNRADINVIRKSKLRSREAKTCAIPYTILLYDLYMVNRVTNIFRSAKKSAEVNASCHLKTLLYAYPFAFKILLLTRYVCSHDKIKILSVSIFDAPRNCGGINCIALLRTCA